MHQMHKRTSQIQLRVHEPIRVLYPDLLVVRDDLPEGLLQRLELQATTGEGKP